MVLIDPTPILPVTDALVVSRMAQATLVAVDSRSAALKAVRRTLQLLAQVNAPVRGLVLNGLLEGGQHGYGYGYGYESEHKTRRQRTRGAVAEGAQS